MSMRRRMSAWKFPDIALFVTICARRRASRHDVLSALEGSLMVKMDCHSSSSAGVELLSFDRLEPRQRCRSVHQVP